MLENVKERKITCNQNFSMIINKLIKLSKETKDCLHHSEEKKQLFFYCLIQHCFF